MPVARWIFLWLTIYLRKFESFKVRKCFNIYHYTNRSKNPSHTQNSFSDNNLHTIVKHKTVNHESNSHFDTSKDLTLNQPFAYIRWNIHCAAGRKTFWVKSESKQSVGFNQFQLKSWCCRSRRWWSWMKTMKLCPSSQLLMKQKRMNMKMCLSALIELYGLCLSKAKTS